MALPNACSCVSSSLPSPFPSRGWVLLRKQPPAASSHPAVNLHSPNRLSAAFRGIPLRATASEDSSGGANRYVADERDTITAVEVEVEDKPADAENPFAESFSSTVSLEKPPPPEVPPQSFELLESIDLKFDSEDYLSIALYGGGALVALWFAAAVVGAIDSIPLFPKLMEVVGLGYTLWFTWRYLIFKRNREELLMKISELKQEVLGSKDD